MAEAMQIAITKFLRESNAIEGILHDPTPSEIGAATGFLWLPEMSVPALNAFQSVCAPNHPLRSERGMDVMVGDYIAPPGGPDIPQWLEEIVKRANRGDSPWQVHIAFEGLHPYLDGNGRTGRMLWAWQMLRQGKGQPFSIGFLHRFYYQTLEHNSNRTIS